MSSILKKALLFAERRGLFELLGEAGLTLQVLIEDLLLQIGAGLDAVDDACE